MNDAEEIQAARNIVDQFGRFVAILLFISGEGTHPSQVTNNGTASFIDTGSRKLIVTCSHVVDEFRKKKNEDPNLWIGIGFAGAANKVIHLPEQSLIDSGGRRVDLATFPAPATGIIEELGKDYFRCLGWPPARPNENDLMAITGYPGELREVGDQALKVRLNGLAITIDSVSDRVITSVDVDQTRLVVKIDQSLGTPKSLGGMSGSAAYKIANGAEPRLIGFLSEAGEFGGVHMPIRITHADFLNSDGTIDWSRVSW
jgi:hypothetical protein